MGQVQIVTLVGPDLGVTLPAEAATFGACGPVLVLLLAKNSDQVRRANDIAAKCKSDNVTFEVQKTGGVLPVRHIAHAVDLLREGLLGGTVWINGDAGDETDRLDLIQLATAYELPVKRTVAGRVTTAPRQLVGPGRLVRALHFAVSRTPSNDNEHELREMGFAGLVGIKASEEKPGTLAYAPTPALLELLADERFVGVKETESACADLLDRLGDHQRAKKLRGLVRRWTRNRLWSVNQVPEMVAHNDDHAIAVDRNVSFLCEAITDSFDDSSLEAIGNGPEGARNGVPPGVVALTNRFANEVSLRTDSDERAWLSTRDVYLLAVAAWLHDWGHASMILDDDFETDPIVVRKLHGYISSQLIMQNNRSSAHGLTPDPGSGKLEQERKRQQEIERAEIALLCAHHQGTSSCSNERASIDSTLKSKLAEATLDHVRMSFDDRFNEMVGHRLNAGERDSSKKRLQVLLALLRVADAADVGGHRTPDYDDQDGNRGAILDAMFQLRTPMQGGNDNRFEQNWVREMAQIRETIGALSGKVGHDQKSQEVDQAINVLYGERSTIGRRARCAFGDDSQDPQWVRPYWQYAMHVVKQRTYFKTHRSVRCAILFIGPDRGLYLCVVPTAGKNLDDCWRVVDNDVLREFGLLRSLSGRVLKDVDSYRWKGEIQRAFAETLNVEAAPRLASHADQPWQETSWQCPGERGAEATVDASVSESSHEVVEACLEDLRSGVVRASDGTLIARCDGSVVVFGSGGGSSPTDPFRLNFSDFDGARLLAVGWLGAPGRRAALLEWHGSGVALSFEDGTFEELAQENARSGVLLDEAVLLINETGSLRFYSRTSSAPPAVPDWLGIGEAIAIDARVIDKGALVAVLVQAPKEQAILTALMTDEGWIRGPVFPTRERDRVCWAAKYPEGKTLVALGNGRGETFRVRLDDFAGGT